MPIFPVSTRARAVAAGMTAVILAMIGACSTWDTSAIDSPTTTGPTIYPADAAGLTGALTEALSRNTSSLSDWGASQEDATCAAAKMVERFGVERLLDMGLDLREPSVAIDYNDRERAASINILTGCIDFETGLLEVISSYGKLSLASTSCLTRNMERSGLMRNVASGLVEGSEPDPFARDAELARGLARIAGECLEATDLVPTGPLQPIPESGQPVVPETTLVDPDAPTTTVDDLLVIDE